MNRNLTCKKPYIAFSGIIGAGKTTLAENIGKYFSIPVYKEDIQNQEILSKFYKDKKKYAFPLQIQLLSQRLEQQHKITWSNDGSIQDRSIYEDLVFVRSFVKLGLLSNVEADIYENLFTVVSANLKHPTCIVYLKTTPEIALERIKKRGRDIEQNMDLEYVKNLCNAYEDFIQDISCIIPVIVFNWDQFSETKFVAETLYSFLSDMTSIRYVDTPSYTT